jgi:hypothetical protein
MFAVRLRREAISHFVTALHAESSAENGVQMAESVFNI